MKIFGSYADAPRNSILATFGSFGLLEVAMRDSSAARSLRVSAGARVTVSAGR
jgi:S-adenosylmethionine hydrolase